MLLQLLSASGYLSVFIVPALLVYGVSNDMPYLAFGVVMLIFPMARVVFGEHQRVRTLWHEAVATALDRLPVFYGVVLLIIMAWLLHRLRLHPLRSAREAIELGL